MIAAAAAAAGAEELELVWNVENGDHFERAHEQVVAAVANEPRRRVLQPTHSHRAGASCTPGSRGKGVSRAELRDAQRCREQRARSGTDRSTRIGVGRAGIALRRSRLHTPYRWTQRTHTPRQSRRASHYCHRTDSSSNSTLHTTPHHTTPHSGSINGRCMRGGTCGSYRA
jgi:hypothetical protein